ncbi:hypothetical protein SPBR_07464 [Sporothrix brasiliensis 5110]|uniref:U6 snRNA phosphodiesterase n=1 Tax=Sporothrix brasiliensis 5110 TaxID=1398154 RepID=A0A0C2ESG2_9PEZI|nr:uncharacterized protein SPBR_07464 [Sporothrix brasiliensis 5110]KIH89299.1 hypothetical protein SPBR_07464 [Sporothrix brasiliensis 5110]
MGLVDYTSDDEDSSGGQDVPANALDKTSALPPLPRAFHDLYASTVRTAPADDPSLHQGRQRAIPHVAGQWPSHLYIEWFPQPPEHAHLSRLLDMLRAALQGALQSGGGDDDDNDDAAPLFHSFLTSDLGAPLPLHISLSRPFVLTTAEKAAFVARLEARVKASGVERFDVAFGGLDWFRSPDSARAFLVLRVVVEDRRRSRNEPLVSLLEQCNKQVTDVGQPALYTKSPAVAGDDSDVDPASFHISVAWTLAPTTTLDAWADATQQAYDDWQKQLRAGKDEPPLTFAVESIKAKIGNVVTDIPLRPASMAASASTTTMKTTTDAAVDRLPRRSKRSRSDSSDALPERRRNSKKSLFGL